MTTYPHLTSTPAPPANSKRHESHAVVSEYLNTRHATFSNVTTIEQAGALDDSFFNFINGKGR